MKPEHFSLVLQDVRTVHGSQFKRANLIVCSPPCQEFSWMAMPWSRAKAVARALCGEGDFPDGYRGSRTIEDLTALFDACFRIQREASEAAGHHIPMVVENVRSAQPWVGRARGSYGSFYFWGDVPALMPYATKAVKVGGMGWYPPDDPRHQIGAAFNPAAQGAAFSEAREARKVPGFRFDGSGRSFQSEAVKSGAEAGGWFGDGNSFGHGRQHAHKSSARKAASARIAKIPERLSRWIGQVYLPSRIAAE